MPTCEDQGMAFVPYAALGSGQLTREEREKKNKDRDAAKRTASETAITVSEILEEIANDASPYSPGCSSTFAFRVVFV